MSRAIYDNLLLLKDAGALVASGAGQVGGQARVIDLANADIGRGRLVADSSAVDYVDGNETYKIELQCSNDITFGTGVVAMAEIVLQSAYLGRRETPFTNRIADDNYLRYARLFVTVGGTTPSWNGIAFITKE